MNIETDRLFLNYTITDEDRERGKARMIEDAWAKVRARYYDALAKFPHSTIRITLTAEEDKGPYG